MYDRSQLMKGTMEGCILGIIEKKTTYGYEIVERLQDYGFREVKEGTIYPLLLRLEKKKLICSQFRPSPLGPARKYYSLTEEGSAALREFARCWREVDGAVNAVLEERREGHGG